MLGLWNGYESYDNFHTIPSILKLSGFYWPIGRPLSLFPYDSVYFKAIGMSISLMLRTANFHTIPSILKLPHTKPHLSHATDFHTIPSILKPYFYLLLFCFFHLFPYDSVYFKANFEFRGPTTPKNISIRFRLF